MFCLLSILILFGSTAHGKTIQDFYNSAIENTAIVKNKSISSDIAKENKMQVTAALIPDLSLESNSIWREQVNVGPFGEGYQHSGFFSLNQPIFQGGSEYYAIGISKNLAKDSELDIKQEQLALYYNIAQAFYKVLSLREISSTFKEQKNALGSRLKTLEQRVSIGKSKGTEVLAAQSQLARLEVEIIQLNSDKVAAEIALMNLSGESSIEKLEDASKLENLKVDEGWEKDLLRSPNIKKAELAVNTAERTLKSSRGGFLPTVDLTANYYLDRAGILSESNWDVGINASWKFFTGGLIASENKIAALKLDQQRLLFKDLKRNTLNTYKLLKERFFYQQKVLTQMKKATDLAKRNYEEQVKEADRGLINQLEVLRILDEYIQIKRDYNKLVYESKTLWVQLKTAAGKMP